MFIDILKFLNIDLFYLQHLYGDFISYFILFYVCLNCGVLLLLYAMLFILCLCSPIG